MSENVLVNVDNRIATVTVNRPEKRNALDIPTRKKLKEAFRTVGNDDNVRVVVLRGAGERSFIAGADLEMVRDFDMIDGLEFAKEYSQGLYNYIAEHPKPTIAAIDGFALGGGTELAIACDLRIATNRSKFGLPEASIGLFPAGGGTQRLVDIVGTGTAKELIFTGKTIDAKEAEQIDLVNHTYDETAFDDKIGEICQEISSNAPMALQLAKESLNRGMNYEAGLNFERIAAALMYGTDDKEEGIDAFINDREAKFTGQ